MIEGLQKKLVLELKSDLRGIETLNLASGLAAQPLLKSDLRGIET